MKNYKSQLYNLAMQLIKKPLDDDIKEKVAVALFEFSKGDKETEQLAQSWLEHGYIHSQEDNKTKLYELNTRQKQGLCKRLCTSKNISFEKKNEMLSKVLAEDKSDLAQQIKLACFAGMPDPKMKEQVWKEFTDPKSKLSLKDREAQMDNFYQFEQSDSLKPYLGRFYENLPGMYKANSYTYFKSYF